MREQPFSLSSRWVLESDGYYEDGCQYRIVGNELG